MPLACNADQRSALRKIRHQRLFTEHRFASLETWTRPLAVLRVRRRDIDAVDQRVGQQLVQALGDQRIRAIGIDIARGESGSADRIPAKDRAQLSAGHCRDGGAEAVGDFAGPDQCPGERRHG